MQERPTHRPTNGPTDWAPPELRVPYWIDADGNERPPLSLADLGPGHKVLYCFQHWCAGCHSMGFPTLQRLVEELTEEGFGFAVVQTVFEGAEENTVERLRETQLRYELALPFGHDPALEGRPSVMEDYQTGGTPWFLILDPAGSLVFTGFHLDADKLIAAVKSAD